MAVQNIRDLLIHNSSTGQILPATCAGAVRFHNPNNGSHLYGVAAGLGHRCTTDDDMNYAALADAAKGPGAFTLTVLPSPIFVQDSLVFAANAPLAGRQAPIGGIWVDEQLTTVENPAGSGIYTGTLDTSNDCRTYNPAVPPNPNYSVEATLHCTDSISNMTIGILLHIQLAPFHAYTLQYGRGSHTLKVTRWTTGNTNLASIPFTLGTATVPSVKIKLQWNVSGLEWFVNDVSQGVIVDATYPLAGFAGTTMQAPPGSLPNGTYMTGFTAASL